MDGLPPPFIFFKNDSLTKLTRALHNPRVSVFGMGTNINIDFMVIEIFPKLEKIGMSKVDVLRFWSLLKEEKFSSEKVNDISHNLLPIKWPGTENLSRSCFMSTLKAFNFGYMPNHLSVNRHFKNLAPPPVNGPKNAGGVKF